MKWHSKNVSEILVLLESDSNYGLSESKVEILRKKYGENALKEVKKQSLFKKFILQFNDFMVFILLLAAALSAFISYMQDENDFVDPIIILLIVTLNAILGVFQENRAEKSLEALKNMSSPTCKVIRKGRLEEIKSKLLVPGDIIVLETGDSVPADARLISCNNLKVEESALTGESIHVEKNDEVILPENSSLGDRINMVFAGSSVSYGRSKAIVVSTGMDTEVGKIADLIIKDESPETPLQIKLEHVGKVLGITAIIICIIIFALGIVRHFSPFTMFMTSVSLAVAAIPEGLPAIVTIMLAIGVQRMVKRNVIIKKLPAVETLGSANIICSDKTGTLTQNKMKVVEVCDVLGILSTRDKRLDKILTYGSLCNDSTVQVIDGDLTVKGDPTETAIVNLAISNNIDKTNLEKLYKRVGEVPFDSKRKLMSTLHIDNNKFIAITKGAPDILLKRCKYYYENGQVEDLTPIKLREIENYNIKMADKALRVLALAFKEYNNKPSKIDSENIEKDLIFLGLIGIMDPPRKEAKDAVKVCKEAGIKPVMITGDHIVTAKAIAHKLGIMKPGDKAMTGEELSKISSDKLCEIIDDYSVFARVSPEHKVRIVKAFQEKGNIVAMTGDGVNDAPALKAADIGCAMGITGTDVAKGASDMILLDDNFATIVSAVKEGRGIYSNVRKAIHFLLSSNVGEIITIFIAILLGWDTPLLAAQLLWINLVTDSFPAIALGLDPADRDIMKKKPFSSTKSFFSDGLWQKIAFEGCMIGMLALLAFGIGTVYFDDYNSHVIGRTMCFATLSISQLIHAFNVRTEKSLFKVGIFENMYLIYSFILGLILQLSVIIVPKLNEFFKVCNLNFVQWIIVSILCISPIVIVELEKKLSTKKNFDNYKEVYQTK